MTRSAQICRELNRLQTELAVTVNQLWALRISTAKALAGGNEAGDFLPRRLAARHNIMELKLGRLQSDLETVIAARLDRGLMLLEGPEDNATLMRIRRVIRYIRNAYAGDHLRRTLTRLLAAHS